MLDYPTATIAKGAPNANRFFRKNALRRLLQPDTKREHIHKTKHDTHTCSRERPRTSMYAPRAFALDAHSRDFLLPSNRLATTLDRKSIVAAREKDRLFVKSSMPLLKSLRRTPESPSQPVKGLESLLALGEIA